MRALETELLTQRVLRSRTAKESLITELPHDEQRMLLNAKRQITNMELLALALTTNNEADYRCAVEALERQAVF